MKLIFMGTPEFAVPSLERLVNSNHKVLGLVTGPDKPVGRGQKVIATPIKRFAIEQGLTVLTPKRLKDENFIAELKQFNADIFVVVAFRILPEAVFTIPPKGTINLHGSLLPKYRGAAPINWAIINGETETGLTTFFIEKKVDTGEIILQHKISIGPEETAGELHDKMCEIGAEFLLQSVNLIEQGTAPRIKQAGEITLAPKLTKETCRIDWTRDAISIYNLVRGLSPFPRAFTCYKGKELKVCCATIEQETTESHAKSGQIIDVDKKGKIFVATGNGVVSIIELQPESKRRMTTAEFLRGHKIELGEILV